jgi:sulfonate transport system ATP-binding protein
MLRISRLAKQFDNGVAAPRRQPRGRGGEIAGLVGTSGCGKSTLLRIICGLEAPSLGEVFIDDTAVRAPRPEIGVVFQEPRLMPWLTVRDNVKFGLEGYPKALQSELAAEAIGKVGLEKFADGLPKQLSGGWRSGGHRAGVRPSRRSCCSTKPFSARCLHAAEGRTTWASA